MRFLLLSFTVLTAFAAAPVLAQTATPTTPPPATVPHSPGKVVTGPRSLPSVEPLSHRASNIDAQDTRSTIAPALPSPPVGPNASATDYLTAAQSALSRNRTGEAQEALENAETLLLSRSVPQNAVNTPDQSPAVQNINAALHALASNDRQQAMNLVQQTIPMTQQASAAGSATTGTMAPSAPPVQQ